MTNVTLSLTVVCLVECLIFNPTITGLSQANTV